MKKARENAAANQGIVYGLRVHLSCLACGKDFEIIPSAAERPRTFKKMKNKRVYKRKFCSSMCARKYRADRFDRYVANPESLALPQCYDEFLTQDELPCLVEGCGWRGHNLSTHMNLAHGMPAAELKELAGFNVSTGVVSRPMHEYLADLNKDRGNPLICQFAPDDLSRARGPMRSEGREHKAKAQALMDPQAAIEGSRRWRENNPGACREFGRRMQEALKQKIIIRYCAVCGDEFSTSAFNPPSFCSDACRKKRKKETSKKAKLRYREKQRAQKVAP
jgi:hypothetical protein